MKYPRYPRVTRARTNDQRLLMEIRDHIVALPLAKELKHQDVETAKRLRQELDDLHELIAHQDAVIRLLQRAAGIDAAELTEDELSLLTEAGAMVRP